MQGGKKTCLYKKGNHLDRAQDQLGKVSGINCWFWLPLQQKGATGGYRAGEWHNKREVSEE